MKQKDTIEILKAEIEIPEIVQKKAAEAFTQIKGEKVSMRKFESTSEKTMNRKSLRPFTRRRMWPAAAAAAVALTVFGAGAAAAYMQWSRGLEEGLRTTAEQRQVLEDKKMASFVGQSVTQGDVTVTMQQSIVDNYFAYLSFKVEGFEVEDGIQPGFSGVSVEVEDSGDYTGGWNASFYDGLVPDNDGRAVHAADGTPLGEGEQISYTMEDGSLEFQVMMQSDRKGCFIGKPIHVELKDLGTYAGKAEDVEVAVEGTWKFDWTLQGSDEVVEYELNTPLGDSGATLLTAELSPISISVSYDFPRQEETEMVMDENGDTMMRTMYAEAPYFSGVRLKDGTMYTRLAGGGAEGYTAEDSDVYESTWALRRVIDVEQVESLLFIKSYPEGEQPLTEENLYIVPVE